MVTQRLEHEVFKEVRQLVGEFSGETLEEHRDLVRTVLQLLEPDAASTPTLHEEEQGSTVQVLTQTSEGAYTWGLGELLGVQVSEGVKCYQVHVLGTKRATTVTEDEIRFFPEEATPPEFETIAHLRLKLIREEPQKPYNERVRCAEPDSAAGFLHHVLEGFDREIVGALYLDGRHRAVGHTLAYVGSLTRSPAEVRGIFVPALLSNSSGVILFHTHPSGELTPSRDDIDLTRRCFGAGETLGIPLLDHIILGEPPEYLSLKVEHTNIFVAP